MSPVCHPEFQEDDARVGGCKRNGGISRRSMVRSKLIMLSNADKHYLEMLRVLPAFLL